MWRKLAPDTRRGRVLTALGLYVVCTAVYFATAAPQTIRDHTPFNHFALLAEAWLSGRLDLPAGPPGYAQNNDFANFDGRWYVTFPPFPAVLLLPLVKLGGGATRVQDGQFFLWLAGIGPAVLYLVLEKLRRMGLTAQGVWTSLVFTVCFAFGSVYYFTAVQGTVWFAAHVVGVMLAALYALFALGAERPVLAGLMLGLGFMTRSPLLFAFPLFLFESLRTSLAAGAPGETGRGSWPDSDGLERLRETWRRLDKRRVLKLWLAFALPLVLVGIAAAWHNHARFGDPFDFGYKYLTVAWRGRMEKWGLFDYHYLGRNLAVVLTSLPWVPEAPRAAPFQINQHGLALWLTTPLYLWLLWPQRWTRVHLALWLTVAFVAVPTLFYQNTGWMQFGYRFSNDYAVFLFCLLAVGGYRMRTLFTAAALVALSINTFGAMSFGRSNFDRYYYSDPSQRVLHQPD